MKKWYKSKLVWLGIITAAIGILQLLADILGQGTITSSEIVMFLSGALTVILRVFFTNQSIDSES